MVKTKKMMVQISENEYQGLLLQGVLLRTVLSQVGGLYEIMSDRMKVVAMNNIAMEKNESRNTIILKLEPEDLSEDKERLDRVTL